MPNAGTALQKILDWHAARRQVQHLQTEGRRVVFTNGCFDLLHVGHVRYLQAARAMGDYLVVGLNDDASVRRLHKGPGRPLVPQAERAEVLAALACVDAVVIFSQDTPLELILHLRPQVLVKGGDYTLATIVGRPEVLSWGGEVHVIPFVPGYSTTSLIRRILRTAGSG
ncbi:MAG: D-glycero-beta-D-manno-heptose 1-phosphate adenylyltransferase [Desulfobacca sp.]|uniref:D-glycero-beta-D-manno-heptose 1-phosphate adenylyltransferase n=1 Tax=Desulfobacca sp. TaxID=2067990 RepID=UPI004049B30A